MAIYDITLSPILLGRREREAIKPETEDVQKINLALRYLTITDKTYSSFSPASDLYDDIEKFQRQYGCIVGEPLTNTSRTINRLKEELRKEEGKFRSIATSHDLSPRTVLEKLCFSAVVKMIENAKSLGLHYGARSLEAFLYKKGDIRYTANEIRSFKAIQNAEKDIFDYFLKKTMLGKTSNQKWNDDLKNMKNGQTIPVNDYWDRDLNNILANTFRMIREPDFYLTFGDVKVTGIFNGTISKLGETISYRVQPTFKINDRFDWEADGLNRLKYAIPGYNIPLILEWKGIGRPFQQIAEWKTDIKVGSVKI